MAALYKIVFGNNVHNELLLPMYDIGTDDIPECCDIEIDISRNYVSVILVGTICPNKLFLNKYYIKHCPRTIFDKQYMEVTLRIPEIYFKDAEHILNKKFNSISFVDHLAKV